MQPSSLSDMPLPQPARMAFAPSAPGPITRTSSAPPALVPMARASSSRLANLERGTRNKRARHDDIKQAHQIIEAGYTGYTTASHFTLTPAGSRQPVLEKRTPIPIPQLVAPIPTLPPAEVPWHYEEITAPVDDHAGFCFVPKDVPIDAHSNSNSVRLLSSRFVYLLTQPTVRSLRSMARLPGSLRDGVISP
jgi:hypothetical protein